MKYQIKIEQKLKYTETIIGETDSFEKAIEIVKCVTDVFKNLSISIQIIDTEEAKEENE